jgi:hypothetical protein
MMLTFMVQDKHSFFTTNNHIIYFTVGPRKKTKLHKRLGSREQQDDTVHGDGVEGAVWGGGGVIDAYTQVETAHSVG